MPLKSRCSFITFIPKKPGKYRNKFWVLADVQTKYAVNIIPHLNSAQEKEKRGDISLAQSVVMSLVQCVKSKGYNITCDNFFTSLTVAKKLSRQKISIVGTIKKTGKNC